MDTLLELAFRVLMVVFVAGWTGCAITIPIVAFKFLMVPFEKNDREDLNARVE